MLITFSGVDGSGKSTQINFVASWLKARGFAPQHLHITQWTWVYQIGERLGGRVKGKRSAASSSSSSRTNVLRQLVSIIDLLRFKWMWRRIRRRRGVLLCDRYFYDLGVNALYRQTMSPLLVDFIWRHAPVPDVAFLLDVQPDVAHEREGEHDADYYVQKRHLYLESSIKWPVNQLASNSIAQIQAQIETILLEKIESAR